MFEVRFMRHWDVFMFMPYTFDGSAGQRVYDWILHLGFIRVIKYKVSV